MNNYLRMSFGRKKKFEFLLVCFVPSKTVGENITRVVAVFLLLPTHLSSSRFLRERLVCFSISQSQKRQNSSFPPFCPRKFLSLSARISILLIPVLEQNIVIN